MTAEGASAGHIPGGREFSNMPGLCECRSTTDPIIRAHNDSSYKLRAAFVVPRLASPTSIARTTPPMVRPFPPSAALSHTTQTHIHTHKPTALSSPLLHHALPFLVPRVDPNDQANRAGDTLSGKTGRLTKEGEPECCVATSSVFMLRLPSAPRTNPTSRASRTRRLPVCRCLDAVPQRLDDRYYTRRTLSFPR